jgi:hypothetical protein
MPWECSLHFHYPILPPFLSCFQFPHTVVVLAAMPLGMRESLNQQTINAFATKFLNQFLTSVGFWKPSFLPSRRTHHQAKFIPQSSPIWSDWVWGFISAGLLPIFWPHSPFPSGITYMLIFFSESAFTEPRNSHPKYCLMGQNSFIFYVFLEVSYLSWRV